MSTCHLQASPCYSSAIHMPSISLPCPHATHKGMSPHICERVPLSSAKKGSIAVVSSARKGFIAVVSSATKGSIT